MKRFLSIMLVAAMLMSVFYFNVSAAVPTKTGGEWSVLISDNFDGDAATYFTGLAGSTSTITYPAESEGSSNKVVDLQIDQTAVTIGDATAYWDGASIGAGTYTTAYMGGSGASTIYMPNSTVMIEFDMCGKTMTSPLHVGMRVNNGSAQAVKINPNNIDADTWYTFRIVVERTADTDTFTVDNTTVYKKLRDGNDDFVKVEGEATATWSATTELDYGIGASACGTKMIAFGVTAHNSYIRPYNSSITSTTKSTGTANGTTTHTNYVPEVADAHYRIDNVTVYAKSAETTHELSNGILASWDMEPFTTIPDSDYLTVQAEENKNNYVKFATGISADEYVAGVDYFSQFAAGVDLPETFVLSFDANNASLGSALDVEIYGACATDESGNNVSGIPKRTVYFRSHSGIQNKWYSYKVICTGTPKQAGDIEITAVYRKERGSNEDYTLLTGKAWAGQKAADLDQDYGLGSTMGSNTNYSNINSVKFGDNRRCWLGAYTQSYNLTDNIPVVSEESANQANGVWYIDNVMITEAAALTGDVSVANSEVTAALNLSTAEAATPILAVYDGAKLVDVDFAPVAHEGTATLKADYDTTALTSPKAILYVWDSLANGKPVLAEAIDVKTYID